MSLVFTRLADWAVKNRAKLPQWITRVMEQAVHNPDGFIGRLSARLLGGGQAPNTEVPGTDVRVYIAPTNYSGQGYLWARALEAYDDRIGARNCAELLPGGYAFPADTLVSVMTMNTSPEWADAEWEAAKRFTHVLVEAERPMFGKRFGRDVAVEVRALLDSGVSVAFLCHGTDIRDPRKHAQLTPWSPYPEDPRTATLQEEADRGAALLAEFDLPVFISTPDLLFDVPSAIWCPVIADAERFTTDAPILNRERPRIIHASSNPVQKGSDRLEPALRPLIEAGRVDFELIAQTPFEEMPKVIAGADIVLDQFRLGSYGVAACEAMAAGRVVVGHVLPQVRETVERDAGVPLPIVEATPDTLHEVVAGLIADPERMRGLASAGPAFVARMHTGAASARALTEHWISAG